MQLSLKPVLCSSADWFVFWLLGVMVQVDWQGIKTVFERAQ